MCFREKSDLTAKNIFIHQNPLQLVFEDISTFDAQNAIFGSLLRELDIRKRNLASKLIKKAPRLSADLNVQKRLEALRKDNNNLTIIIIIGRLYLHHLHRHLLTLFRRHLQRRHRHLIHFKQTFKRLHHRYLHPLY